MCQCVICVTMASAESAVQIYVRLVVIKQECLEVVWLSTPWVVSDLVLGSPPRA